MRKPKRIFPLTRENIIARMQWQIEECEQCIRDAEYWNGLPHNQKHTPLDVEDFRVMAAQTRKQLSDFIARHPA